MRPTLSVLSNAMIGNILDEAKRIMAETGMEIRGEKLRQRRHTIESRQAAPGAG